MPGTSAARVKVPSVGGITSGLQSYAVGMAAGVGFNMLKRVIPGGGLISGAVAAAVVGAAIPGAVGQMVAVNLGFANGLQGLGNILPGLGGTTQRTDQGTFI